MGFSDLLPGLDAAVGAHACDPAILRLVDGAESDVDIIYERPAEGELLGALTAVRDGPTVEVAVAQVARLPKGAVFVFEGRLLRVTGAPTRPGDGRWWLAVVEDAGAET